MRSYQQTYLGSLLMLLCVTCGVSASRSIQQTAASCNIRSRTACAGGRSCVRVFGEDAICTTAPIGGAVISAHERTLPTPYAYFPLSAPTIESWPEANFKGRASGAVLVSDPDFGAVYHCQKDPPTTNSILLEDLEFARTGAFAINLWIKLPVQCPSSRESGAQYIFSVGVGPDTDAPNQIHLRLASSQSSTLQAVVIDRRDEEESMTESEDADLRDGQWHMITISTMPRSRFGRRLDGFRLFVDGVLVDEDSMNGGGMINVENGVHLCRRFDGDDKSQFEGRLTQLSFFSTSLTEDQVALLYSTVHESLFPRQSRFGSLARNRVQFIREDEIDSGLDGQSESDQRTQAQLPASFNFTNLIEDATLCHTREPDCPKGDVCARIHNCLLTFMEDRIDSSATSEANGVCVPRGSETMGLDGSQSKRIPIPLAYFPLKGGFLDSWPVSNYRGYAVNAQVEEDELFGEVFSCKQEEKSVIVLENVPYGVDGDFGINFWFKSNNLNGDALQYLYSHGLVSPSRSGNPWTPNQVQILMPENGHVGAGVLRVVIKDSDDNEEKASFLDSDGEVSVPFMKQGDSVAEQPIQPTDGLWHMVTITTQGKSADGYLLYLDGKLVGTMDEEGEKKPPGGQALRPGGKIYLCGRNDAASNRYFDGNIAELALFDSRLSTRFVSSLYRAALDTYPVLESITN